MKQDSAGPRPIGVLGIQGDFDAHARALARLGEEARVIRWPRELQEVDALVMPGGESTTLIKLMREVGFFDPLRRFQASGRAIYGTCAGAILLARRVTDPEQYSLGLIDIDIQRNAYGRQRESFETAEGSLTSTSLLEAGEAVPGPGGGRPGRPLELVLIRAPRITRVGRGVQVLATHRGEPVLVRQGPVLAGTFHPELGEDSLVHRYFLRIARGQPAEAGAAIS